MEDKINIKAVAKYSGAFAAKISEAYFSKKEKISGSDILNLCQIRQVNLFVLRDLMKTWQQERK